jgi:hypothetical protein
LPGIAHVQRALDLDVIRRKAVDAEIGGGERFQPFEHAVHLVGRKLPHRLHL